MVFNENKHVDSHNVQQLEIGRRGLIHAESYLEVEIERILYVSDLNFESNNDYLVNDNGCRPIASQSFRSF